MRVNPFTWVSYTTVRCQGVFGRRSYPQSKYGLMTTLFGTYGALSRSFFELSGSAKWYGNIASFQSHGPSTAFE